MPELSNLLKDRLSRAGKPEVHPDADLLTAYAEQALPSEERTQVLEHLSRCNQCREVVFLMTEPAAEEAAVIQVVPAKRRRWFLSPTFGMVAAVCAMAVGIGFVVRMQTAGPSGVQNGQTEQAKAAPPATNTDAVDQDSKKDSKQAQPAEPGPRADKGITQPSASGRLAQADGAANSNAPAQRAPALAGAAGNAETKAANKKTEIASAAPARRDYVNLQRFASDAMYDSTNGAGELPSAPSPAPAASTLAQAKMLANEQSTAFADLPADAVKQSQRGLTLYQPPSAQQSPGIASKFFNLGKRATAKRLGPAIPQEAARSFAMAAGAPPTDQAAEALAAKPAEYARTGVLNGGAGFSVNGLRGRNSNLEADGPKWKVVHGKLLKFEDGKGYVEMASTAGMEFSAVSENGADVWAGGSHAALIHSTDGGASWEKIALGDSAIGTVMNIVVSGSSVVVTTSANQTWSSQDSGKNWQKK